MFTLEFSFNSLFFLMAIVKSRKRFFSLLTYKFFMGLVREAGNILFICKDGLTHLCRTHLLTIWTAWHVYKVEKKETMRKV